MIDMQGGPRVTTPIAAPPVRAGAGDPAQGTGAPAWCGGPGTGAQCAPSTRLGRAEGAWGQEVAVRGLEDAPGCSGPQAWGPSKPGAPTHIEGGGAPNEAVHDVALCQEQLREVGAVLARDASHKRHLAIGRNLCRRERKGILKLARGRLGRVRAAASASCTAHPASVGCSWCCCSWCDYSCAALGAWCTVIQEEGGCVPRGNWQWQLMGPRNMRG